MDNGKGPILVHGVRGHAREGHQIEDARTTEVRERGKEGINSIPPKAMARDRSNMHQHRSPCSLSCPFLL